MIPVSGLVLVMVQKMSWCPTFPLSECKSRSADNARLPSQAFRFQNYSQNSATNSDEKFWRSGSIASKASLGSLAQRYHVKCWFAMSTLKCPLKWTQLCSSAVSDQYLTFLCLPKRSGQSQSFNDLENYSYNANGKPKYMTNVSAWSIWKALVSVKEKQKIDS